MITAGADVVKRAADDGEGLPIRSLRRLQLEGLLSGVAQARASLFIRRWSRGCPVDLRPDLADVAVLVARLNGHLELSARVDPVTRAQGVRSDRR